MEKERKNVQRLETREFIDRQRINQREKKRAKRNVDGPSLYMRKVHEGAGRVISGEGGGARRAWERVVR